MITVGVTPSADLPGLLLQIPQAEETARHVRVSYSYYKGVPAPLTNGGFERIWRRRARHLVDPRGRS